MLSFLRSLTQAFENNMEEGDDRSIGKAVQLGDESLSDHLVSWNKHHPLTAPPQAEHRAVLLLKLHAKENR